jgi:hypothetical protein
MVEQPALQVLQSIPESWGLDIFTTLILWVRKVQEGYITALEYAVGNGQAKDSELRDLWPGFLSQG